MKTVAKAFCWFVTCSVITACFVLFVVTIGEGDFCFADRDLSTLDSVSAVNHE
jgi:hypothetical protein